MIDNSLSNKRIAKNTVLLYVRTFLVMMVSLYTSRVVLQVLGVEDFGVYQVVGGMVAMFAVVSNSLSTSISRFVTYEVGGGNKEKLYDIFATSRIVQLVLVVLVVLLGEVVGIWFMKTHMQIPSGRMDAAIWVLQFSLLAFCINLLSVPYNACIIAHEHMKAFAYISILEAVCKLGICYLLIISPSDKLITYAFLLMLLSVCIRVIYTIYCRRHFEECHSKIRFHKSIFKEMFGFAGWSFYTNTNYLLNNQGVNLLINVFFGVTYNAARGIANQVENAVMQFVNSFTTAINPQITKNYASGAINEMHLLVCRGAKFSFFLMYMMALPLICEASTVLNIWLTVIPDKTVLFVQLSLVLGMFDCIGATGVTACMATGRIKKYSLVIGTLGLLEFPVVWIAFASGAEIEMSYYLYIVVKTLVIVARVFLQKQMVGLGISTFLRNAIFPVILVAIVASIPSVIILSFVQQSFIRLIISVIIGVMSVAITSLYLGMSMQERSIVLSKVKQIVKQR